MLASTEQPHAVALHTHDTHVQMAGDVRFLERFRLSASALEVLSDAQHGGAFELEWLVVGIERNEDVGDDGRCSRIAHDGDWRQEDLGLLPLPRCRAWLTSD